MKRKLSFILALSLIISLFTVTVSSSSLDNIVYDISNSEWEVISASVDIDEYNKLLEEMDLLLLEKQSIENNMAMSITTRSYSEQAAQLSSLEEQYNDTWSKLIQMGAARDISSTGIVISEEIEYYDLIESNIANDLIESTTTSVNSANTNLVDAIYNAYGGAYNISGYQTTVTNGGNQYTIYEMSVQNRINNYPFTTTSGWVQANDRLTTNITRINNVIGHAISIGTSFITNPVAGLALGATLSKLNNFLLNGTPINKGDSYQVHATVNARQYFVFVWDSSINDWRYTYAFNGLSVNQEHSIRFQRIVSGTVIPDSDTGNRSNFINNPNSPYSFTNAVNNFNWNIVSSQNINKYDVLIEGSSVKQMSVIVCGHHSDLRSLNY